MAPSTFTWVPGFRDQTQVSGIEVGRLTGQVKALYSLSQLAGVMFAFYRKMVPSHSPVYADLENSTAVLLHVSVHCRLD